MLQRLFIGFLISGKSSAIFSSTVIPASVKAARRGRQTLLQERPKFDGFRGEPRILPIPLRHNAGFAR